MIRRPLKDAIAGAPPRRLNRGIAALYARHWQVDEVLDSELSYQLMRRRYISRDAPIIASRTPSTIPNPGNSGNPA